MSYHNGRKKWHKINVHEARKRGNFAQNVKSCYEPVEFTCHIGNVLAAVVSIRNIFGTEVSPIIHSQLLPTMLIIMLTFLDSNNFIA